MDSRIENRQGHSVAVRFLATAIVLVGGFFVSINIQDDGLAQDQFPDNQPLDNVTIPLSSGFIDGEVAYFIATDASTEEVAASVTNSTGFNVNYAPALADTPVSVRQQGYVFVNGAPGEEGGPLGGQQSIATAAPGDPDYSPLFEINYVEWNTNNTNGVRILESAEEVMEAQQNGELTITKSNVVINSPGIIK